MSFTFACRCGQPLLVREEYVGRRVRCPKCQLEQTIPAPAPPMAIPITPIPHWPRTADAPAHRPPPARTWPWQRNRRAWLVGGGLGLAALVLVAWLLFRPGPGSQKGGPVEVPTTVLPGHQGLVRVAAFSPDGTQAVTVDEAGTARLWDGVSGKLLHELAAPPGGYRGAAFSPDGRQLALVHRKGATLFDAREGKEDRQLDAPLNSDARVWGLVYTPKGLLAVGCPHSGRGPPGRLTEWDLATGRRPLGDYGFWIEGGSAFVALADSQKAAYPAQNNMLVLKQADPQLLEGHSDQVTQAAFSPDGEQLVSAGLDGEIILWDLPGRRPSARWAGHKGGVFALSWSADGRWLASGGADRTVRLWDAGEGRERCRLLGDADTVLVVAVSPDARRLLSADVTGRVVLRTLPPAEDFPEGEPLVLGEPPRPKPLDASEPGEVRRLEGHTHEARAVAFFADGRRGLSGGWDRTVRVWDLESGEEQKRLEVGDRVEHLAVTRDGRRAFVAGERLALWDIEAGREVGRIADQGVSALALSPDGREMAWCGRGTVAVHDAASGEETRKLLDERKRYVQAVGFSADGRRVLAVDHSGEVLAWERDTGRPSAPTRVPGALRSLERARLSSGGQRVLAVRQDQFQVWDLEPAGPARDLPGRILTFGPAAISPDGRRAVTVLTNLTVWDLDVGRRLAELPWRGGMPAGLTFSPDGRFVLSGGHDRIVRMWRLPDPK